MSFAHHDDRPDTAAARGLDAATLASLRRVAEAVLALAHTSPYEAIDRAEADYAMEVRADRLVRLLDEVEAARAAGVATGDGSGPATLPGRPAG